MLCLYGATLYYLLYLFKKIYQNGISYTVLYRDSYCYCTIYWFNYFAQGIFPFAFLNPLTNLSRTTKIREIPVSVFPKLFILKQAKYSFSVIIFAL